MSGIEFKIRSDGLFELTEDFIYEFPWETGSIVKQVRIKKGFVTNFATIPGLGRWIVSPIDPDILVASVVHDYLVEEFKIGDQKPAVLWVGVRGADAFYARDVGWKEASFIMKNIMRYEGAPTWKRMIVHWSVRGWKIIRRIIKKINSTK